MKIITIKTIREITTCLRCGSTEIEVGEVIHGERMTSCEHCGFLWEETLDSQVVGAYGRDVNFDISKIDDFPQRLENVIRTDYLAGLVTAYAMNGKEIDYAAYQVWELEAFQTHAILMLDQYQERQNEPRTPLQQEYYERTVQRYSSVLEKSKQQLQKML